ncbi:gamma-glutamylcyclotransferase-like [Cydia fagiglandana]|uniref:gamma-glutamylcyclotransferase-like n=1 Tax=Cydia fagiglandana TaxID=1458189 RepID=UPI002FEE31B3
MIKSEIKKPDTFLYFGYGSNMLSFRIHMLNPSAEFVTIGWAENYRVDFIRYSSFWGGPTATLVPTANAHAWGVMWRLHNDDLAHLDLQEGVEVKKYFVTHLLVHTTHMGDFTCRCYIQRINPLPRADNEEIPIERWPSWALKEIMIYGAKEHGLPDYYIKNLKRLKHNGEEGAIRTWCLLDRYARNMPCECRVPGRIPREPLKLDNKLKKDFRWTTEIIEQKD